MASWAENSGERPRPDAQMRVCLACGLPLRDTLARLGALRCIDCREIDRPLDESLVELGIPQNWPAHGHACFSAEHHLTYLAELRTGDRMSARVRLLGRSERAAHALVYLLDETHERLSFVMEEIFLHIDMGTRLTAPWPEDVAAALDARVAEEAELPWEPDVSGCLRLR